VKTFMGYITRWLKYFGYGPIAVPKTAPKREPVTLITSPDERRSSAYSDAIAARILGGRGQGGDRS
jgi:hypothetical protein